MAEPIFTATRVSLLFLAIESSCRNGLHPTAALPSCQSFPSFPSCLPGPSLAACVTFFAADSYIVRAKMATRRPLRKGPRPRSGPSQKAGPAREPEERLLVEAAQGDPAKFDALYELHFERVYAFIASRMRDRATAEDLTSEVFHKALASLSRYEWRGVPFAAWLLRIAANAIIDQSKRAAREFPARDDPREASAGRQLQASELRAIEHRAQLFQLVG